MYSVFLIKLNKGEKEFKIFTPFPCRRLWSVFLSLLLLNDDTYSTAIYDLKWQDDTRPVSNCVNNIFVQMGQCLLWCLLLPICLYFDLVLLIFIMHFSVVDIVRYIKFIHFNFAQIKRRDIFFWPYMKDLDYFLQ